MITKYYTDLLNKIEKPKREARDIEIGDYNEWTNGDIVLHFGDQHVIKSTKKIEEHKQKYVAALSDALKELERDYKIPALMLAGVAYIEFGGVPLS